MAALDTGWLALVAAEGKPKYLAIADAICEGVREGRLAPGARLPPQREVAAALGVDLTTVTRAYAEARRRGQVTARVGRGTFVAPATIETPSSGGLVDMSMNLPPQLTDADLARRMWRGLAELEKTQGMALLMRYQSSAGVERDRAAGAAWLAGRVPHADPDNTVVAAGAQASLVATIGALVQPGEAICTEALAYPGLRAAAAHLGVSVFGLAMDEQGITPEAFAHACREVGPKALCCTPTLQNPTTATMSHERREAIAAIARRHHVPIVEDDAYSILPPSVPPPLAALAPELTHYIAGLAKVLSPALRIAYVAAPDARTAGRIAGNLRAISGMASPLTAALATRWLEDGVAAETLAAIRAETRARRALAEDALGPAAARPAEAFHLWLELPRPWTRAAFQAELRAHAVAVVPSDAFATTSDIPEAVRIGLGAAPTRADAARALLAIRRVLDLPPTWSAGYV